jgi:chromosome segregation ATPase
VTVKSTGGESKNGSEAKKLRKDLRAVELKVEMINMELRVAKAKAEEAQMKQEEGERHLRDVISRYKALENNQAGKDKDLGLQTSVSEQSSSEGGADNVSGIFRTREDLLPVRWNSGNNEGNADGSTFDLIASFDGSQLTSFGGTVSVSSAEGRDEKIVCEKVQFEGATGRYLKLRHEHDAALGTIAMIKGELVDANQAAEQAQKKQERREEHLRDMIYQYKKLKSEYDALEKQIQETRGGDADDKNTKESYIQLLQERDAALAKIPVIENELEDAKKLSQSARKKQLVRDDHLRQVIAQYKTLQHEHSLVVDKVDKLKEALRSKKESSSSGRKKDHGQHEKRDTGGVEFRERRNQRLVKMLKNFQVRREGQDDAESKSSQKSKSNNKRKGRFRLGLGNFGPAHVTK